MLPSCNIIVIIFCVKVKRDFSFQNIEKLKKAYYMWLDLARICKELNSCFFAKSFNTDINILNLLKKAKAEAKKGSRLKD